MTGAPKKAKRRVRRNAKGSGKKFYNTFNQRGTYRVGGQLFSRLMFPDDPPKELVPRLPAAPRAPGAPPSSSEYVRKIGSNIFEPTLAQTRVSDYTLGPAEMSLWIPGKYTSAGLFVPGGWERKPKRLSKTASDLDGKFGFDDVELKYDKTYRVIATLEFPDKALCSERIKATFRVPSRSASKMKEYLDVVVRIRHQIHFSKNAKKKRRWRNGDRYTIKARLCRRGTRPPVLWMGGAGSLVFGSFALNVPVLGQHTDAPANDVTLKVSDETWTIPADQDYMCSVTCTTMLLRYFGYDGISVEKVIQQTGFEYLYENRLETKYRLSAENHKNRIIQLKATEGHYPYCEVKYLAAAFTRLMEQKSLAPRGVTATWRTKSPTTETWENTRSLLGAGWPLIGIDVLAQGGGLSISHGGVIRGGIISNKGRLMGIYVNDPGSSPPRATLWKKDLIKAQIIMGGRAFKQSEMCPTPERLLLGGNLPARRLDAPKTGS